MKTIFVIEQGSYSDYRVVGVYSTREAAEIVLKAINDKSGYDDPTIAEWALNPGVEELNAGMKRYTVKMLRDGAVEEARCGDRVDSYDVREGNTDHIWRRSKSRATLCDGRPDILVSTVWADDEQHAIKIVNERRGQMIAMGQWDEAP